MGLKYIPLPTRLRKRIPILNLYVTKQWLFRVRTLSLHNIYRLKSIVSFNYRQMILAFTGWWTFWILFQSFVLHHLGISWRISFIDAAISNAALALAGFASEHSLKYYQPTKGNTGYRLAWGLVIAFICTSATRFA